MALEVHLTLDLPEEREPALRAWADSSALKVTCIQLSRGERARQIMLSFRSSTSPSDSVARGLAIARAATDACRARYVRTKVEAAWSDSTTHGSVLYLEHHVRVRLGRDDGPRLHRLAAGLDAHLSRNAFRPCEGANHERFLTQRFEPERAEQARLAFERLMATLARAELAVTKVERERILVDDCRGLDAGWMDGARC